MRAEARPHRNHLMHLTKLHHLLHPLTAAELRVLGQSARVSSALPPVSKKLLLTLVSYYTRQGAAPPTAAALTALCPPLKNAAAQSKAAVPLVHFAEQYLAQEEWKRSSTEKNLYLLKALKQRGQKTEAEKLFSALHKQGGKKQKQQLNDYYLHHLITEENLNGFYAKLKRNPQNNISPVLETLDIFYALKKLRYLSEAANRQRWLGITNNYSGSAESCLALLKKYRTQQHPYIFFTCLSYQMVTAPGFNEGWKYYHAIKTYISRQKASPLPAAASEAITYAINFCLWYNNCGITKAGKEFLWWVHFKIKKNILLENKMLSPNTYVNYVTNAFLQQYSPLALYSFIETYTPALPPTHAATHHAFALGLYYYRIKNFSEADYRFQQAQAKDEPVFNAIIKRWQFMSMYEHEHRPENISRLQSHLESFERYIHRHHSDLHRFKPHFTRFIANANKLINTTAKNHARHTRELTAEPFFAGKNWLCEMLKHTE